MPLPLWSTLYAVPQSPTRTPPPLTPPSSPPYSPESPELSRLQFPRPDPKTAEDAEDSLSPSEAYHERLAILSWILVDMPSFRSPYTLGRLHTDTLKYGLKRLRACIAEAVERDKRLCAEYREMLAEEDRKGRGGGFAYAGWYWDPPPDEAVDGLSREQTIRYLEVDVGVYGEVGRSVRCWRRDLEYRRREMFRERGRDR